jgi:hypothetical protein
MTHHNPSPTAPADRERQEREERERQARERLQRGRDGQDKDTKEAPVESGCPLKPARHRGVEQGEPSGQAEGEGA